MRIECMKRYLLAAALPLTLLSACADREPEISPDDQVHASAGVPAAAVAPPLERMSPDAPDLRGAVTVSGLREAMAGGAPDVTFPESRRMTRQEVVDRFAAAADAGDPEAAYMAGRSLSDCHRILRDDTPAAVLSQQREDTLELQQLEGKAGYENLQQQLEQRLANRASDYSECNALAPQLIARSIRWLEQAAAAGHEGARREYPRLAMAEFESREGIIRDPLEARRRQALARALLEEAVNAGDRAALQMYVEAQRGRGPLYSEDRRTAQVYGYVESLAMAQPRPDVDLRLAAILRRDDQRRVEAGGRSREDAFRTLLSDGPPRYPQDAFSNEEWMAITEEGRRIFLDVYANPRTH